MSNIEFDISLNLEELDTVKNYDGPGKGRKQCPNCKIYVGARNSLCTCGHSFDKKKGIKENPTLKEEDKEPIPIEILNYVKGIGARGKYAVIYAAAGRCPLILEDYDRDTIYDFCHQVVDKGLALNKLYTPQVIKSWLRSQVPFEKQKDVLKLVDSWYIEVKNEVA